LSVKQTVPESGSGGDRSACPVVTVKTGAFVYGDRAILLGMLICLPILFGLAIMPQPGALPSTWLSFAEVATLVGCIGLFLEEGTQVRRIRLSPTGVTFHYLIHRETRRWDDIEPYVIPARKGVWGVQSRRAMLGSSRKRGYPLTLAQARALLEYPACPRWSLPSEVARSIDVGGLGAIRTRSGEGSAGSGRTLRPDAWPSVPRYLVPVALLGVASIAWIVVGHELSVAAVLVVSGGLLLVGAMSVLSVYAGFSLLRASERTRRRIL